MMRTGALPLRRVTFVTEIALLACCGAIAQAGTVQYCGYQNLRIVMEQVPENWNSFWPNDHSMFIWTHYMDVYRYKDDDGSWGNNTENEFGGFPSGGDLDDAWGFSWGSFIALSCQQSYSNCKRILESDVVFNPAKTWTYDRAVAEYSSKRYYYSTCLHELGHCWGMQRPSNVEDYSYTRPTVMHGYSSSVVQDKNQVHWKDAELIRADYDVDIGIPTRRDMSVSSKYPDGSWKRTTTEKSNYSWNETFDVRDLMVENNGTEDHSNVRVRVYLSRNRTISTSDRLCGTWTWDDFDSETWWVGDLNNHPIPDTACGVYFVGAMVTRNGGSFTRDDGWMDKNNTTWLIDPVNLTCLDPSPSPASVAGAPFALALKYVPLAGAGGPSFFDAVVGQGVASGQIQTVMTAPTAAEFGRMLREQPADLVVYAALPTTDSSLYEDDLVAYLRKGGRAIISDPRTTHAGAAAILQAAGTQFSGQTNGSSFAGLNILGRDTHTLTSGGGSGIFSYGVDVTEASAAYARFANEGDPAIVGIGGRTVVAGFTTAALPATPAALSMFATAMDALALGRGEPETRVTYRVEPASWTTNTVGNVASVTLLPGGEIDVPVAGGQVQFAVLVDVESTDSEGLFKGNFDLVASDPSLTIDPLNLGVDFRDPDAAKSTPDVRPMVDQSVAVPSIFNSVFSGGSSNGLPGPGSLTGVFLQQESAGSPEIVTRGVGQLGNDLVRGSTILAVGTMHVPAGMLDYTVMVAPGSTDVFPLAPSVPATGGMVAVNPAEVDEDSALRIVRPRTFPIPPDVNRYGPDDCNNPDVNVCDDGQLCTHDLCESGACENRALRYADINNDGFVNAVDALCLLDSFAGLTNSPACVDTMDGLAVSLVEKDIAPCPSQPPTAPPGGVEVIDDGLRMGDGFVNGDDVLAVIDRFAGIVRDPLCEACMGGPMAASSAAAAVSRRPLEGSAENQNAPTIVLRSSTAMVAPGGRVVVEAWLRGPVQDLRAYQVTLQAATGATTLKPQAVTIEDDRAKYAFEAMESYSATNPNDAALMNLLPSGGAAVVAEAYLGSFTYSVARSARGSIAIHVDQAGTLLRDATSEPIAWRVGDPLAIEIQAGGSSRSRLEHAAPR